MTDLWQLHQRALVEIHSTHTQQHTTARSSSRTPQAADSEQHFSELQQQQHSIMTGVLTEQQMLPPPPQQVESAVRTPKQAQAQRSAAATAVSTPRQPTAAASAAATTAAAAAVGAPVVLARSTSASAVTAAAVSALKSPQTPALQRRPSKTGLSTASKSSSTIADGFTSQALCVGTCACQGGPDQCPFSGSREYTQVSCVATYNSIAQLCVECILCGSFHTSMPRKRKLGFQCEW